MDIPNCWPSASRTKHPTCTCRRIAADDPCTATCGASTSSAGPPAGARHGVRHHERLAAQAPTRSSWSATSVRDRGLARFRVNAFNQNRGAGGVPDDSEQDPHAGAAQRPQDLWRPGAQAARAGAGDRPHRLRQVHHAGGDGQLPQRNRVRPHPDGGRPDRIRARVQEVPDQPARSRAHDAVFSRP